MSEVFFHSLTPAEHERLTLLFEEASEVIQAVGKILRHGYNSYDPAHPETNNLLDLEKEIGHLQHAIKRLTSHELNADRIQYHQNRKAATIGQYLHHQGH